MSISQQTKVQIELLNKLKTDIQHSELFIYNSNEDIKEIEKYLWKNCPHEWVSLENDYSRIKYKCAICTLYKHTTMYT